MFIGRERELASLRARPREHPLAFLFPIRMLVPRIMLLIAHSIVRPMPTIQRLKNTVVFKIIAAEVTFREELQLLLLRQAPFVCKF